MTSPFSVLRLLAVLLLLPAFTSAAEPRIPRFDKDAEIHEQVLDQLATLPIQSGGRLMPLDTFARLKLRKYSNTQTLKIVEASDGTIYHPKNVEVKKLKAKAKEKGEDEEAEALKPKKITPSQWLYLVLFQPDVANDLPVFLVDNTKIMTRIGVIDREKRDRYSFNEIVPRHEAFMKLAGDYQTKARAHEDGFDSLEKVEQDLLNLASKYVDYLQMSHAFDGFRPPKGSATYAEGDRLSEALDGLDPSAALRLARRSGIDAEGMAKIYEAGASGKWNSVLERIAGLENDESQLALFPPPDFAIGPEDRPAPDVLVEEDDDSRWFTPQQLVLGAAVFEKAQPWAAERARLLEDLGAAGTSFEGMATPFAALHDLTTGEAAARGEGRQIVREARFNERNPILNSMIVFVIGFILIAFSWLGSATGRVPTAFFWSGGIATVIGLALLVSGIVTRCLIRGRPPISNLYETILFITAVVVGLLILIEFVQRNRMSLALAPFLGALGLFVARKYDFHGGKDTMEPLIAVLDTNFWLATHVIIINIGYAAAVLAAAISNFWILRRLFLLGDRSPTRAPFPSDKPVTDTVGRDLTRNVYGIVCFCLLFSLVGTVLGGIWANESWGRFWGWDPKENGALMIVLWAMIILHARLAGYIRDIGIHVCSVWLGSITLFSWFGTNNLGIGLHSYGFTSGLWVILGFVWLSQFLICVLAGIIKIFETGPRSGDAETVG